jgi:phosphocarrier protein
VVSQKVKIINKLGLHARPSAQLVTTATKFKSNVMISKGELRVNGKSIMGVMMLAAERGSELLIEVEGLDEQVALKELVKVIESGFGEEI